MIYNNINSQLSNVVVNNMNWYNESSVVHLAKENFHSSFSPQSELKTRGIERVTEPINYLSVKEEINK